VKNLFFTWAGLGDNLCLFAAARNYYRTYGTKLTVCDPIGLYSGADFVETVDGLGFNSFADDQIKITTAKLDRLGFTPVFINSTGFSYLAPSYTKNITTWPKSHMITRLAERLGMSGEVCIDVPPITLQGSADGLPEDYVCIMTGGLQNYKAVSALVMQGLIDQFKNRFTFVQIGAKKDARLRDVIDRTGVAIADAATILKKARFLITGTSGLMHLARSVACKAFVLQTHGEPLSVALYNLHRYVSAIDGCGLCSRGLRDPQHQLCFHGYKCIRNLNAELAVEALEENLDYLLSDELPEPQFETAVADPAKGLEDFFEQQNTIHNPSQYFRI